MLSYRNRDVGNQKVDCKNNARFIAGTALFVIALGVISGCATYTTPGGSVPISSLAEADINTLMARQPQAVFPAHIVVARIQAPQYRSPRVEGYGSGRYSVLTTRDIETEADFEFLSQLPMIAALAPINRLLLPPKLDTIKDLRTAAARARADILLVYGLDTSFNVGTRKYAPLNVISLGFLKNQEATVTTTASAVFFDVRTEFVYGFAETTARESESVSLWNSAATVDELRVRAEQKVFHQLISELEKNWDSILKRYATIITPVPDRPSIVPDEKL